MSFESFASCHQNLYSEIESNFNSLESKYFDKISREISENCSELAGKLDINFSYIS